MTPIDRYRLETHSGPYESWPPDSVLLVDGRRTTTRIAGYEIEAQYRTPLGDLVVTSYDCPFEESNAFTLLDASFAVLAKAELGIPYDTFLLHEHWPIDACTLALHYQERIFYTLQIRAGGGLLARKPRLRLSRKHAWRRVPRMVEAHDRLQASLARIGTSLRDGKDRSAG